MMSFTTVVLRAGMLRPREMPIADLVPGDLIYLSAGDIVPAPTCRLFPQKNSWSASLQLVAAPFLSGTMLSGGEVELLNKRTSPGKKKLGARRPVPHNKPRPALVKLPQRKPTRLTQIIRTPRNRALSEISRLE